MAWSYLTLKTYKLASAQIQHQEIKQFNRIKMINDQL